jgi:hypothetical protein
VVEAVNPVKVLVKTPVPIPSLVMVPDVVGLGTRPYATPRLVTNAPPSLLILPPVNAAIALTPEIFSVVTVGTLEIPHPLRQRTETPMVRLP